MHVSLVLTTSISTSPAMTGTRLRPPLLLLLLFLLLTPPPTCALPSTLRHLPTLLSLSHSLLLRIANARAARGDLPSAARARALADRFRLLNFGRLGWDFLRNYAWRDLAGAVGDVAREASEIVEEVVRLGSDGERVKWGVRNHRRVLDVADRALRGLQRIFNRSGPLRETVMTLRTEVLEGELVRDCLEVGAKDLEGLINIARDIFFTPANSDDTYHEL